MDTLDETVWRFLDGFYTMQELGMSRQKASKEVINNAVELMLSNQISETDMMEIIVEIRMRSVFCPKESFLERILLLKDPLEVKKLMEVIVLMKEVLSSY